MNFSKIILLLLVLGAFSNCSTIKVSTDYDRSANFSGYKTYAFAEGVEKLPVNDLNRNRLLQAVEAELAEKGLTKGSDPDLQVKAATKESATAYNTGGYGWRYGGGMTTIDISEYVEGTLIISLVDAQKNQLVWQGVGVKSVDESASAEKREQRIREAVDKILASYPPKR